VKQILLIFLQFVNLQCAGQANGVSGEPVVCLHAVPLFSYGTHCKGNTAVHMSLGHENKVIFKV
jgi:hypothetical protein